MNTQQKTEIINLGLQAQRKEYEKAFDVKYRKAFLETFLLAYPNYQDTDDKRKIYELFFENILNTTKLTYVVTMFELSELNIDEREEKSLETAKTKFFQLLDIKKK